MNVARDIFGEDDPLSKMLDQLAEHAEGLKGDDKAAYEDLEFFSRHVMGAGDGVLKQNSDFLKRIYHSLQFGKAQEKLILGPRQSAKSTAATVTWLCWSIGRDRTLRNLVCVASLEGQGLAFMRQIDQVLTQNERYIKIFGQLKPAQGQIERWTVTEKTVLRPTPPGGIKDPSFAAVGLNSSAPSKRADRLLCDDLVTGDNALSDVARPRVIRFVLQTLFPIVVPGGMKVIVGSRWHPEDLYSHVAQLWGIKFPKAPPVSLKRVEQFLHDVEVISE